MVKMFGASGFTAGVPISKFTDYGSYLKECTRKVWAQWLASHLCGDAVASTNVAIVRGREKRKATNAPLEALLESPNPEQTLYELLYLCVMHIKFTGQAFLYKFPETGRPQQLWTLNPKRVEIVANSDGTVNRYQLSLGQGMKKSLPFESVIHIRRPHPNNDFFGLGEVEAGEALLQGQVNAADWSSNFWRNGAAPSGVMVESGDNPPRPEDWEKLKRKFKEDYAGRENSGKIAWLYGKWEYVKLGLTMEEMQNIESQKWSVEQIFALNQVPLSVAGIKDAANYATAQLDEQRFRRYAIRPLCRMIADTLSSDLAELFGAGLRLEFELAELAVLEALMAGVGPMFDRGMLTVNEARKLAGLAEDPTRPEWNEPYMRSEYVPMVEAGVGISDIAAAVAGQRIVAGSDSKPISGTRALEFGLGLPVNGRH